MRLHALFRSVRLLVTLRAEKYDGRGRTLISKSTNSRSRRVAATVAIAATIIPSAALAEPEIKVQEADRQLSLRGTVGRDSDLRSLSLEASSGQISVKLQFSDLVDRTTGTTIDRHFFRVTLAPNNAPLTSQLALTNDRTDLQITVGASSVNVGSYDGQLLIRATDSTVSSVQVPIHLDLRPSPDIVITPDAACLTDVQLTAGFDLLRETLSARKGVQESCPIEFTGITPPLLVQSAEFKPLKGGVTGRVFPTEGLKAVPKDSAVIVDIDGRRAWPDRYVGALVVHFTGLDRPISVPASIDVRAQPVWVLVFILIGIAVGRLAKWRTDVGDRIAAAQQKLDELAARADELDEASVPQADRNLHKLETLLDGRKFDDFGKRVPILEKQLDADVQLGSLIKKAETAGDAALGTTLDKQRGQLWAAATLEEIDKVVAEVQKINEESGPVNGRGQRGLFGLIGAGKRRSGGWKERAEGAASRRRRQRFVTYVGIDVGLPLLNILTVAVLALIGFGTLYASAPSFGANPMTDALAAITWGLSADIAGRTLANLPHRS